MTILIIGSTGQVGWELDRLLAGSGAGTAPNALLPDVPVVSLDYPDIDLASADSVVSVIRAHAPILIINAAAYTAVDRAEEEEGRAMAINGTAPGIMAEEMKRRDGAVIHYSTDYVFDGTKAGPYTEEDAPNPLGAYGRTKLAGEKALADVGAPHVTLRTSWIYGSRGRNFLLTILKLAHEREELRIVDDQTGAPTWCRDLAEATIDIIKKERVFKSVPPFLREHAGLYHLTNAGATTWHGFARAITDSDPDKTAQSLRSLLPIPTEDYPTPAPRPHNSRLDCARAKETFAIELPPWDESLRRVMEEIA